MIQSDSFSRQTRSPETGGEVVYADVFAELDDIFETQDGSNVEVLKLEDVVDEAINQPDGSEHDKVTEIDHRQIMEELADVMKDFDSQIQDAANQTELLRILSFRKDAIRSGFENMSRAAGEELAVRAQVALEELKKRWTEAEARLASTDFSEKSYLDLVRTESIVVRLDSVKTGGFSQDFKAALDRDLHDYMIDQPTIDSKVYVVSLASTPEVQELLRTIIDFDILLQINEAINFREKIARKELLSGETADACIDAVLDYEVFKNAEAARIHHFEIQRTHDASSDECIALMAAAFDADLFEGLIGNDVKFVDSLFDKASSSLVTDVMRRVMAL